MRRKTTVVLFMFTIVLLTIFCQRISEASQKSQVTDFFIDDASDILENMSLEEKIGQILIFGFWESTLDEDYREWLVSGRLGNIKIFLRNVESKEQVQDLTKLIKDLTELTNHGIPPFIATDMEGGIVNHIRYEEILLAPPAGLIGATHNRINSSHASRLIALTLHELGINMNFAPCVDVLTNNKNRVIGTRSYSSEPWEVYLMIKEFIKEHERNGILAITKHFPGHGMTDFDSHIKAHSIDIEREELERVHLFPYRRLIDKNILDGCMVSHIVYNKIDPMYPATFSSIIVNGILRNDLEFNGIIVTDDLEMFGSQDYSGGIVKSFILAFRAGSDMFLIAHTKEMQETIIHNAASLFENGILSEDELNEKVLRILKAKKKYLLNFYTNPGNNKDNQNLLNHANEEIKIVTNEGIVQISSTADIQFPVNFNKLFGEGFRGAVLAPTTAFEELAERDLGSWDVIYIRYFPQRKENAQRIESLREKLKTYDIIIIGLANERQAEWAQVCIEENIPFAILSIENPFYAIPFTSQALFIATSFAPYSPAIDALFNCVFHTGIFQGIFPYYF